MISSVKFVINLNTMADALDELGELSEYFQRCNITLIEADKLLEQQLEYLIRW